jgi:hypothetical protein
MSCNYLSYTVENMYNSPLYREEGTWKLQISDIYPYLVEIILIVREYTVQGNVLYSLQCYTEPEFLNIQWRLKSRLFNESCLFKGQSVQQGLQWLQHFLLLLKTILCKQSIITLKLSKIIYICIWYLKYLETFLETLHSHFQPSCHFKMFKNSGSDLCTM